MITAHRIELRPTRVQAQHFAQACGNARAAYNWALEMWNAQYECHKVWPGLFKSPREAQLRKDLNACKCEQFPWMNLTSKCAPQLAIKNLGQAWKNYFDDQEKPQGERRGIGRPRFKTKRSRRSFTLDNLSFQLRGKRLYVAKLGEVRMTEPYTIFGRAFRRRDVSIARWIFCTISETAGRWYASITAEIPDDTFYATESQSSAGVDLGITALATLSTGEKVAGPKPMRLLGNRVKRLQRGLSRKTRNSRNYKKAKLKLAALYHRIACIRHDALHKLTTELALRFWEIGIEALRVKNMVKNHCLAGALHDQAFGEFRRQLTYKMQRVQGRLVAASPWFASTKTCSCCGFVNDNLTLREREWGCQECGAWHDRDTNAAINLRQYAGSLSVSACGAIGSGGARKRNAKLVAVKQELTTPTPPLVAIGSL